MSYLTFHFQEGVDLNLSGPEKHYLGSIVENAAFGSIGLLAGRYSSDVVETLAPFIPEGWDRGDPQFRAGDFKSRISFGGDSDGLRWRDKPIKSFALVLNTAIVAGSDPVALAAKMHGTCETHGWFAGKDRAWLADVIQQGLDTGIFRIGYMDPRDSYVSLKAVMKLPVTEEGSEMVFRSMGWIEIVEQLRKSDEGAVVMSYSVTGGFPEMPEDWQPEGPVREPENDWETRGDIKREMFGELPDSEKFALALAQLQDKPIGPDTLRTWLFRHELTMFDLLRGNIEKIEKQLGLTPDGA